MKCITTWLRCLRSAALFMKKQEEDGFYSLYVSVAVQHTSFPLDGSVKLAAGAACLQIWSHQEPSESGDSANSVGPSTPTISPPPRLPSVSTLELKPVDSSQWHLPQRMMFPKSLNQLTAKASVSARVTNSKHRQVPEISRRYLSIYLVCGSVDQLHVPPCGVRGLETVTLMMKDIHISIIWELKCVNIKLNQGW